MVSVSVLVPIYNVAEFIEKCTTSLFEQTFEDIEYIFVDDKTQDNSIEILNEVLQKYPNRIKQVKIIIHEKNKGLAAARNTGVENANGEYILHVDSDDYLELNAIELLYNKAIEDNSEIVSCNILLEWNNATKEAIQNIGENKENFIQLMLSAQTMVGLVNKLIKKSLYIDNGIEAIEGINLGEDFVTTPRLTYYANKISKINLPLYHYIKINSNSYTSNLSRKNIDNVIFVLNELTHFFYNKEDYHLYRRSLLEGKVRKKIELIFNSEFIHWRDLFNIFPEIKEIKKKPFLNLQEKIVYFFIHNKYIYGLRVYKALYMMFFNFIQNIRGRA